MSAPAAGWRWREQFAPSGRWSAKVSCVTCGRKGWAGSTSPHPWQKKCLDGHPHRCDCGRVFATLGAISAHQRPRRVSS